MATLESLMWLFTVPVLKLAIKIGVGLASSFLVVQILRWYFQAKPPNPFQEDARVARRPYIHDQKKRDLVIKQGFSREKVPSQLDAIVIGSGIGGLTTAAILAKAGKKVLVLEQHDQAGGCCHTFIDKGYEFDVGIHYIGEMGSQTLNKTLLDQISEGQIEWAPLDKEYDVVEISYMQEKERKSYPITHGFQEWKQLLKKQFPDEEAAIDKYFEHTMAPSKSSMIYGMLKLLPLWLVNIVLSTGLLGLFTNLYKPEFQLRTSELVAKLTTNKDLRTVFTYCWGDYGTPPSKSAFTMQALLNRHFATGGGWYPVGGASEIAYNIIPVIEKAGGRVLVRANVTQIVTRKGKACGVKVVKGDDSIEILAPLVISSAGVYNTFQSLLPKEVASKSYYLDICKTLEPGVGAMNVFLGLNASAEELGLKRQNVWAFTSNDSEKDALDYFSSDREKAMDTEVPLLFISFPSAKDPEWTQHPGREGKATCAIVTLANWEWFKSWENEPLKKRGDDYDEVKKTIGDKMIEQVCQLFPQIRDKIDFIDIGSPVTNKTYLGQPHGEIYGLDHTRERFNPFMVAKLRPETDIPGLYLTGQDILSCGFTGGLFAGAISAQSVLGRGVMSDLIGLHNKTTKGTLSLASARDNAAYNGGKKTD